MSGSEIHLRYIVGVQGERFGGYQIIEVSDQAGRLIEGPYPRVEGGSVESPHPIPFEDEQSLFVANSIGEGLPCGSNIGECSRGRMNCFTGQLICLGDIQPELEQCDGLDNDCDERIDEELPPEPCHLTAGVCSSVSKICDGVEGWRECSAEQYGSDYQETETECDCLDNDCDGVVDQDEEGEWLSCDFSEFQQGDDTTCTLRQSSEAMSGVYRFGSLTLAEGVALDVIADSSGGYPSNRPCHTDVYPMSPYPGGGGLYINAQEIRVEEGARISASAINSSLCESNSNWRGVLGAAGGEIHLLAPSVYINGELSAHGGAGSPWGSQRGGTAGSIQIYADRLTFGTQGKLSTQGGLSVYQARHGISLPGPGAGQANPGGVGAAANGAGDVERSLRITGQITLPSEADILIETLNGDGVCDGHLELWGESIFITDHVCSGMDEYPESSMLLTVTNTDIEATHVLLSLIDEVSETELGRCRINQYRRCHISTILIPNRPYLIRQILEVDYPTPLGSGQLQANYGNRISGLTDQTVIEWDEGLIETGLSYVLEESQP